MTAMRDRIYLSCTEHIALWELQTLLYDCVIHWKPLSITEQISTVSIIYLKILFASKCTCDVWWYTCLFFPFSFSLLCVFSQGLATHSCLLLLYCSFFNFSILRHISWRKWCGTLGAGVILTDIPRDSFPLRDWQSRNNGACWCAIMPNQYTFNK